MSKKFDRDALLNMAHKDVKARYQSLFGEPPRSPNKVWMVNQMEEQRARRKEAKKAQPSDVGAGRTRGGAAANSEVMVPDVAEIGATPAPPPVDAGESPLLEEASAPATPEAPHGAGGAKGAVEAVSDDPTEAATAITRDGDPGPEEADDEPAAPGAGSASAATLSPSVRHRGHLKSMTVEELRTRYEKVVGRTTSSVDKPYLIWKIREAENGKIRVGPVEHGRRREGALADADKTLPLTLTAPAVEAMDAAWRRTGFPSRMTFMRTAIREALSSRGEANAAALLPEKGVA
jgi:hypothetical protein